MAFLFLGCATLIVGMICLVANAIRTAPEVSDDYEIELWEHYRSMNQRSLETRTGDQPRFLQAAE